jgi:plasmid stabilization system protein ParE
LDQIADNISLDKPTAANRFVQRVFQRVEQLASHPKSGSIPNELNGTPYRQLVIPPVRVFYREQDDMVYIVCIMRRERHFCSGDLFGRDSG